MQNNTALSRVATSLQLLHIMDKWTEYLEQGGQIDVMYSDFEKAFDKVSHNRLIYKLKLYGFSKNLLLGFKIS